MSSRTRFAFESHVKALEYALKVEKESPHLAVRVKAPLRNLFAERPEWHVYVSDNCSDGGAVGHEEKKYNIEQTRRYFQETEEMIRRLFPAVS